METEQPEADWFEVHRAHLRSVAYRMMGTVSDAEDIVQDAYLRVRSLRSETLSNPRAYLSKLVTRLCLDRWKSAATKREQYVGPWLPEPLVADASGLANRGAAPEDEALFHEDVSVALLLALERLSPLERAAFILHDVFDVDYAEVADSLGREVDTCRQLAARARRHVKEQRPRVKAPPEEVNQVAGAFVEAVRSGELDQLRSLLAEHATFTSDGGGRVSAATNVIRGADSVARFVLGIAKKFPAQGLADARLCPINGAPGVLFFEGGRVSQALIFEATEGQVQALYAVRNPDKLAHLSQN